MKTTVAHIQRSAQDQKENMFFPEGIIGFSEHKEYRFVQEKSKDPFLWLESAKDSELSFIVINPREFKSGYSPFISQVDKEALEINDICECNIYAIVCVPKDSDEITANLLAPIFINKQKNIGRQIILKDQDYDVKHSILEEMLRKIEDTDVSSFAQTK
jgi:flagellar assembly factor FliW